MTAPRLIARIAGVAEGNPSPFARRFLATRCGEWALEGTTTIVAPARWDDAPDEPVELRVSLVPLGSGQRLTVSIAAPKGGRLQYEEFLR